MKAYRICWTVAVALLAAASAVGASAETGWPAIAVTAACSAVLGAMVGVVWAEEAGRSMVLRCAAGAIVGGLLVVGLPAVLGVWSLVALTLVVVTAPPLLASLRDSVRVHRGVTEPEAPVEPVAVSRVDLLAPQPLDVSMLTDRELERRWHLTAARLRHPGTTADAALALVAERVDLLDEIERRNPEHFAALLDRVIGLSDNER